MTLTIQSNLDIMPPIWTEVKWHSNKSGIVTRVCYKTIDKTISTVRVIYSLSYLTQAKTLKNRHFRMFFWRISCISFSRKSHTCITPNFSLFCCINFRTVLHARWAFSNEMVSSSTVTSSSSLSTGFSLLYISSALSFNVKDPLVSRRLSASRKSDSSISSFLHIFSSAERVSQISNSSALSGSD